MNARPTGSHPTGSRFRGRRGLLLSCLLTATSAGFAADQPTSEDRTSVIIAVGAAGEAEYGRSFAEWAGQWVQSCERAQAVAKVIGLGATNDVTDLELLKRALAAEPPDSAADLWLVLIGHGTFDGQEARFNLRGPDLAAGQLAEWLKPFHRALAVIDCASSSGPFITKLSAPGRVIVTATKSGYEQNYARFGAHFAQAVADPQADLDKDGQTSLLEAFLLASRRVAEFYESEGRLATEHALLDDNGDGRGTPADWFRGVRAVKKAEGGASVDGLRAHQFHLLRSPREQEMPAAARARRDELELRIAQLRDAKSQMKDDDYYGRLEPLLLELARLYEQTPRP